MGYENRDYHREDYGGGSPLQRAGRWLLDGRVHLFEAFGIDVQAHSSLLIVIAFNLLFLPGARGYGWQDAVVSSSLLFLIVLLHEFGHCFATRWSGGDADQIVMHPLGGLALTQPLNNWKSHFIGTVGGPAVNVILCVVCGVGLYALRHELPWRPFYVDGPWQPFTGWLDARWLMYWTYQTSWALLLFNLLPVFPLDGGRMTQELLWSRMGYYQSMVIATTVGIVGAVIFAMVGIATGTGSLLLIAILGGLYCFQMKRQLAEMGPYGFSEYDDPISASFQQAVRDNRRRGRPSRSSKRAAANAAKLAAQAAKDRAKAAAEEAEIDRILAKVSASGMHSLTRGEQRTLREATERQNREEARRDPTTTRH